MPHFSYPVSASNCTELKQLGRATAGGFNWTASASIAYQYMMPQWRLSRLSYSCSCTTLEAMAGQVKQGEPGTRTTPRLPRFLLCRHGILCLRLRCSICFFLLFPSPFGSMPFLCWVGGILGMRMGASEGTCIASEAPVWVAKFHLSLQNGLRPCGRMDAAYGEEGYLPRQMMSVSSSRRVIGWRTPWCDMMDRRGH